MRTHCVHCGGTGRVQHEFAPSRWAWRWCVRCGPLSSGVRRIMRLIGLGMAGEPEIGGEG